MIARWFVPGLLLGLGALVRSWSAELPPARDFTTIEPILAKHCLDCHASQDPEGKLVLETFDDLKKGGESGPVIAPGKSSESLLVKMIAGDFEKDGKKKIMPPGKRKKLDSSEIEAVKTWIDSGAPGPPAGQTVAKVLNVPKIIPKVAPRRSIKALAFAPSSKLIAVGRYGEVELISSENRAVIRKLAGHRGDVNALAFSTDGSQLFAASGEPALFGEVRQWNVADGTLVRTIEGHRDTLYSLALAPDGKTMATGSYDQKIKLWDLESGKELRIFSGHNGAVFDLAFRKDGKILASASADRTVKLWTAATGERRDTLSQSLKELHALAFSPDGRRLVAGGVDNRIRVWEISDTAAETTNPLQDSRFAHEGAILKVIFSPDGKTLATSADDRTVKIWTASDVKEKLSLEVQPDWPSALAFISEGKALAVGRLDGTLQIYDTANGKVIPPPKPQLTRLEPRGLQSGVEARIKLAGSNLTGLKELKFSHPKLSGRLVEETSSNPSEAWALITAAADLKRGAYDCSVVNGGGESGKAQLHVDDLPQVARASGAKLDALPASVWGVHEKPGDTDTIQFEAKAGQTLVFDVASKRLGSKAEIVLTLFDASGKALATSSGFDGGNEPLLIHPVAADGGYSLRVGELVLGASADHFYRLSIGEFPYVVACFPLSVPANTEAEVNLIGYNLSAGESVKIKTGKAGEMELPLAGEKFRTRRDLKLMVSELQESLEVEPNDLPRDATKLTAPSSVSGQFWKRSTPRSGLPSMQDSDAPAADADLFRFESKAGETWIIETAAAQRGSPADTRIEVLHADGKPVERLLLQAVRNSAITFRGIDSNAADCRVENWEEMELNQLLYLQGEVVKLFRAPQGPDSGFLFYTANGKRRNFFDTSATAHANEEPCYIVEPHPPGAKLASTGLPIFPLTYANDDDAERRLGADSKLHFTAPADGAYLIRVAETRGFGGERFVYRLVVRAPRPDFKVTLNGAHPTINAGSGQAFSLNVDRIDGFDGEVTIDIGQLPRGFAASTPLVIQAGHSEAKGTLNAALDATQPSESESTNVVIEAKARIDGRIVTQRINNFGRIKLGDKPKLLVSLEPGVNAAAEAAKHRGDLKDGPGVALPDPSRPQEITIAPGQIVPAWLRIQRNGHEELVTFTVENLPHGVIVDNIGLSGVLIPKDASERQIFLSAAKWVPETDRLCYAIEAQAGRQTSIPVWLRVRKPSREVASAAQ